MLLVGLIIAAAAGAFAGLLITDNAAGGPQYTVTLPGHHLVTLDMLQVFLYGIALAVVFCLGIAVMSRGAATMRRRRAAELEAGRIRAERDALAAHLGIPIDRLDMPIEPGFLDRFEQTAPLQLPLPPSAPPWTNP
jgi:hypothetical protein